MAGRREPGTSLSTGSFPAHGWIGALLIATFWVVNWGLEGPRTHWAFFPLWLGYSLMVDGIVLLRTGTSLLARSRRRYLTLFAISAPAWWVFEALNLRTQNWLYIGAEQFTPAAYAFWTTLSFTTVIPAVFGSAELAASFSFVRTLGHGPRIGSGRRTTLTFFFAGWVSLALVLAWPMLFFPFVWVSLFCIVEPLNIWLGHRSLAEWTRVGDWRPAVALWLGVLMTAFFWEMWNFLSNPKWIYDLPWGDWVRIFEMPLLGYGGYLPFSLELFALYHLVHGLLGECRPNYVRISPH